MALRATTILPDMIVHFDINRSKSVRAMEEAVQEEQDIFLVTQLDPQVEDPGADQLYAMGCIARVKQIVKLPKGMMRILVEGLERAELVRLTDQEEYLEAEVEIPENSGESLPANVQEAMLRSLKEIFLAYCQENPKVSRELSAQFLGLEDVERLVDQISINLPLEYEQRQKLLEASDLSERYELLGSILANETEIFQIRADIQRKVQERVDKGQREYILREQLKLIREELGDDTSMLDADKFAEAVEKLQASQEVKDKIREEIRRFKNVGYNSSESAVIRGYIETLLSLPWDKESQDNEDLKRAREILDQDHYGLKKVKERIIQQLAVMALNRKQYGSILLFVGAPGTGKTSIGQSIARALGREYVRISLGGIRDEAEIRGHRRTYIGAMPGRIMEGMKRSGVSNPVMVLDEVDKLAKDYGGDPASALLEVLDPEQNSTFTDHYMNVPYDLSNVLFVCTANTTDTIPEPLLNRMEVISFPGYTAVEKYHIAKKHLIPKALDVMGIRKGQLKITDSALRQIIEEYTMESGVRDLKKNIETLCRTAAVELVKSAGTGQSGDRQNKDGQNEGAQNVPCISVTKNNLSDYLGRKQIHVERKLSAKIPGVVTGLAWTRAGGAILFIETKLIPGKGKLQITGQLGDVMKESVQIALSLVKSMYPKECKVFEDHDLHIHVPAGAVPKDGPSAGITLTTALASLVTGRAVDTDIAMTGEVSLRGGVMPIGGLPEKLMAAQRAGIRRVFIPEDNADDLEDVAGEVKEKLEIIPVKKVTDILKKVL